MKLTLVLSRALWIFSVFGFLNCLFTDNSSATVGWFMASAGSLGWMLSETLLQRRQPSNICVEPSSEFGDEEICENCRGLGSVWKK